MDSIRGLNVSHTCGVIILTLATETNGLTCPRCRVARPVLAPQLVCLLSNTQHHVVQQRRRMVCVCVRVCVCVLYTHNTSHLSQPPLMLPWPECNQESISHPTQEIFFDLHFFTPPPPPPPSPVSALSIPPFFFIIITVIIIVF